MEALLQNILQEQRIHLQQQQHLYTHDLGNMDNLNYGKPPLPPQRKYVSIFRIDGEPILPPLMTTEKRKEMQILREKALKIEHGLRERKQQSYCENDESNESIKSDYKSSWHYHAAGNISQRSQDYYESKLKEAEESMILLKDLIQRQQGGTEETRQETAYNAPEYFRRDKNQEKLQKLQKSEILIYDNSTNEVIQVPADKGRKTTDDQQRLLEECPTGFNYTPSNKPPNLLLFAGVNNKGTTSIPSICLNPPTPLAVNKSLCETLSGAESSESLIVSESLNKSLDFGQDLSSDESFSSMITQSDKKPNRNTHQSIVKPTTHADSYKNADRKLLIQSTNVCAKIQQFEAINSDNNTPQTSPERVYVNRKSCLGTPTGTLSRSATSPSIKLSTSNRSSSSRSQCLAQDSPENSLVRSSSFTLEGPSKALLEHMQQQKVIGDRKAAVKSPLNTARNLSRKAISSPLRAHRDTVESKAKKVQKVELKSSRQKIQQKTSQSKLAQAAAASISPYSSNSFCKTKRSPSDISKSSYTSLQTLQKAFPPAQMRKSNSASSSFIQTKTSKSKLISSTSASCNAARTSHTDKESINQMAKSQKDKFQQLLAQQEEEHQRLQQSFEIQQKLLIEQLSQEMAASQLKSPNIYKNVSIPSALQHKQQNQMNSAGFPLDHGSQKSPTSKQYKHQPSPPSISNNSSYISVDNSQSQIFNSQRSIYGSHQTQSSHPIPLDSHLSLIMDNSNANTSLDISTLSTQTSLDISHATPAIQNNTVHNVTVNKTTTPSSRRRLFEEEINGVTVNDKISPSTVTNSPYNGQRFLNHGQQLNHSNKSSMSLINDSNRRLHY